MVPKKLTIITVIIICFHYYFYYHSNDHYYDHCYHYELYFGVKVFSMKMLIEDTIIKIKYKEIVKFKITC